MDKEKVNELERVLKEHVRTECADDLIVLFMMEDFLEEVFEDVKKKKAVRKRREEKQENG